MKSTILFPFGGMRVIHHGGGQYDDISRCLLMGPIHEMSNGGYTYDVQPPGFIIPQMFRDDGVLKIGFDHVKIEVKFSLLRRVFC